MLFPFCRICYSILLWTL